MFKIRAALRRMGLSLLTAAGIAAPALMSSTDSVAASSARISASRPSTVSHDYAQDRIIVKFKSTSAASSDAGSQQAGLLKLGNPVDQGRRIAAQLQPLELAALAQIGGKITMGFERIGAVVVKIQQPVGIAIEALRRAHVVEYAEPDFERHTDLVPNDPLFANQWGINNVGQENPPGTGQFGTPDADVDGTEAWDTSRNGASGNLTVVGLVDTGTDYNHEDLSANMWHNLGEIPGNGIDDDGNGWVDDVYGIDTCNNDSDPYDDNSHGTHTAGTIGARGNNGKGVTGAAWSAKIMPLKFLCGAGYGYTSAAVAVIDYAMSMKAANGILRMILSNSWGGGGYDQSLYDIINAAAGANILFVAAAGNASSDTDVYANFPSGYDLPNIISVGASDFADHPAYFSNHGCGSVDVFAPGVDVVSTVPNNSYAYYSGTSMATPLVSGIAAVAWQKYTGQTYAGIKSIILNSADPVAALGTLAVTQGRINFASVVNGTAATSLPAVWGVQPAQVNPAGGQVTIQGRNFGTTAGAVTIDGLAAAINSWSANQIVATTPSNLPLGPHTLKVTNSKSAQSRAGGCLLAQYGEVLYDRLILPRHWAGGGQVGNALYVIGGGTTYGMTGAVEQYTLTTGRSVIDSGWDMPVAATNLGTGVIGTKIYVVGGYDWNNYIIFDTLQIFDTQTKTWSFGPSLPAGARLATAAIGMNNKLYVFGGEDSFFNPVADTWIFDPATSSWSAGAPMPAALGRASAVRQGTSSTILVIGGFASDYLGAEVNTVYAYNTATNTWSNKPPMAATRGGLGATYVSGKPVALHGTGSYNGGFDFGRSDGEILNAGVWQLGIHGSEGIYVPLVGKSGSDVYIVGGQDFNCCGASSLVWKVTVP